MKRYKIEQTFPVSVVQLDYSDVFTKEDQQMMMDDIDLEIKNGFYTNCENTPKYQITKNIFSEKNNLPIWKKLRLTFIESCLFYLENVDHFIKGQNKMKVMHLNAWAYKNWKSLNETQINPFHNHNPALLSGVFYLKKPDDILNEVWGTEFSDTRGSNGSGQSYMTSFITFSWIIFPSYMIHRTCHIDSEQPRYVIAADAICFPES